MSRAGRKRKIGPRHPSGQLKKPKTEPKDDKVRASRQPERRALGRELRSLGADEDSVRKATTGEEAESPIGRLWAAGHLRQGGDADSQAARDRYDAATMFAQVVGAYRSVIETPRGGGGSGRGFECMDLLCKLAPEMCECARRKARYDRAFEALARIGRRALMAVNAVAVHRESIGEEDLVYLVAGLEGLRRIFGLTAPRKPGQYRNAN
jgi:hypothetical protein